MLGEWAQQEMREFWSESALKIYRLNVSFIQEVIFELFEKI